MSAEFDLTITEAQDTVSSPVLSSESHSNILARVDFAHLFGDQLLVYGWIFDFADRIDTAFIYIEDIAIDLKIHSIRVRRQDVSRHFSSSSSDEHGFYMLLDLQHPVANVDYLRLSISSLLGETDDSRWAIQRHEQLLDSIPQSDLATLRTLLENLPPKDMTLLRQLLSPDVDTTQPRNVLATLPAHIKFEIDFCGVLDERLLVVYGWFLDPTNELTAVKFEIGNQVIDLLKASISVPRLDIGPSITNHSRRESSRPPGFILVESIPATPRVDGGVEVAISMVGAKDVCLAQPLSWDGYESRNELFALLSKMDLQSAMMLMEQLLSAVKKLPGTESLRSSLEENHDRAVEQLPASLHYDRQGSRYWLHLDQAILVADKGIFLSGWFYAENDLSVKTICHCGEASFTVSKHWIRQTRTDVTSFLETADIHATDHEHGFTCYVPVQDGDRPYWLSVISSSGEEQRMQVATIQRHNSALQTVRSLLGTFHCEHRRLRALLDQQVGPAVTTAWSARKRPLARKSVERFGAVPVNPEVSIIVPLYGRWDFVELQMSQFVNDADFHDIDLIYVVDDPSIYDRLRAAAPNLFGVYGIPFTLTFPGANLGFAGANNFGARYARGKFLLLLNSDVMPKKSGWIRELLRVYRSLENPGLLGVKLVYEDGTLQHAGIEFRRYAPWGGMRINDHPHKGQIRNDLKGTHQVEAVTAACVLIEAVLYRNLKGFSEDYIIGDFEDSDLCLRAKKAGHKNYVALDIELYHLERQSQNRTGDAGWRTNLTAYNCWLHDKRWSVLVEDLTNPRLLSTE